MTIIARYSHTTLSNGKAFFRFVWPIFNFNVLNKYIIAFLDWFSWLPEAFAVPYKTADTVAKLLIEEIYPRYGCPIQIVTDNGTEM